MALYNAKILDHFMHPRNTGMLDDADCTGETGSGTCGDIMKLYLKIRDDVVEDVRYEAYGCTVAIASGSVATELIKGRPVSEALQLTNRMISEALGGLPPEKMQCSVLAEQTIRAAVEDYCRQRHLPTDYFTSGSCASQSKEA